MADDSYVFQHMDEQSVMDLPLLRSAINLVTNGIQILKAIYSEAKIVDFRYAFVNEAGKEFLPAKDAIGKTFLSFQAYPAMFFYKMVDAVQSGTESQSEEIISTEGGNCKLTVRYVPFTDGVCLFFEDAPEEESFQRELLQQAELIAGMGSWEFDIDSREFIWSEGMYSLFNLPVTTVISPEIYLEYVPAEERSIAARIVKNIKEKPAPFEEIVTLLPHDKEKLILKIKAILIRDKKNRPIKIIGIDVDITAQVDSMEKVGHLKKVIDQKDESINVLNSELRSFNSVIARDYKENLQSLYTNLEFIITKEAILLSDASKANIRRAQSSIQRMKLLTDDINTFLQLYEVGVNPSLIDPTSVLENVVSQMAAKIEQWNVKIELTKLPPLYADPLLLSWLFANLFDNSIKFTKVVVPPVIKIHYFSADEMNAIASAKKNMRYVIISVSDNGIGFTDAETEKIFQLFYRVQDKTHYRGSGTGLSICKKIMDLHGGFITAEGTPAKGAIFHCYFPVL